MPEDVDNENFQDYFDSMVEFAKMCGASEARARDEMLEVFKFQRSLMNKVSSKWAFILFQISILKNCIKNLVQSIHKEINNSSTFTFKRFLSGELYWIKKHG